jgi:hypothetical protein
LTDAKLTSELRYLADWFQDELPHHTDTLRAAADRIAALTVERDVFAADLEAAAGELLIDSPTPGTDMARMLIANRLLCRERDELAGRIAALAEYVSAEAEVERRRVETLLSGGPVTLRTADEAYHDIARRLREGSETE